MSNVKAAKIPGGQMKVTTARKRWADVRNAATSCDPDGMFTAVSRFETIAEMALMHWAKAQTERLGVDLAQMNDTQAQTIERLRVELGSTSRRCEIQQDIIDRLRQENKLLYEQRAPRARAERHFNNG